MYSKMIACITKKWKAVVAFIGLVATALLFYLRIKDQKKILEKANESHEKENQANEKALVDLESGLEKINKNEVKGLEAALKNHDEESAELAERKKEFIENSVDNPDLAKDLADRIGAKFVEKKDQ